MLAKLTNFNNMDKNSKFLLIIIGVIIFLLVLIFIINFLGNRKSKKMDRIRKANKKKLAREIEFESKNIEPVTKVSKEKVSAETIIQEEKEEVIEEIEKNEVLEVEDEIVEVLNDEKESDVDRIIREMKNVVPEDNFNLTEFEREQEESAIISYEELCKKAGVEKKEYGKQNTVKVEEVKPKKELYKGNYKPSKFASPIFGYQEEKEEYRKKEDDLNQTFLKSLKEFRSGLE